MKKVKELKSRRDLRKKYLDGKYIEDCTLTQCVQALKDVQEERKRLQEIYDDDDAERKFRKEFLKMQYRIEDIDIEIEGLKNELEEAAKAGRKSVTTAAAVVNSYSAYVKKIRELQREKEEISKTVKFYRKCPALYVAAKIEDNAEELCVVNEFISDLHLRKDSLLRPDRDEAEVIYAF